MIVALYVGGSAAIVAGVAHWSVAAALMVAGTLMMGHVLATVRARVIQARAVAQRAAQPDAALRPV